jgi:hypothetical protein
MSNEPVLPPAQVFYFNDQALLSKCTNWDFVGLGNNIWRAGEQNGINTQKINFTGWVKNCI